MRTFLIIVASVLVTLLVVAGGAYFYFTHKLSALPHTPVPTSSSTAATSSGGAPAAATPATSGTAPAVPTHDITIDTAKLPAAQQQMLKSIGITGIYTLTPAVMSCVEAKISPDRITAIRGGATPTVMESLAIAGCL